ncbi:MAG: CaiB/BaiF CoA-transferase family protein [Steroidobacteraceae bacterium]
MFDLLQGVRVLELAVLINGDNVGMLLADLGADVIKVEAPPVGDYIREFLGLVKPHYSLNALHLLKGKRSIAVDLRTVEGRAIFDRLLATTDIFVTGLTADACEKLGIGYDAQRKVKPDIIFVQYTGFGATGPYASIPTHGRHMNAQVGGVPVEMCADGFVRHVYNRDFMGGTQPASPGPMAGAPYAALAAVAALQRRGATGQGSYIDVAASDAVLASSWIGATMNFNHSRVTDWTGAPSAEPRDPYSEGDGSSRYQIYETKDRRFVLFACIEGKFFHKFCRAIGRDDLIDPAAANNFADFGIGEDAERHALQAIFHTRTQAQWIELAIENDLAIGPVHRLADVPDDPHNRARGILRETVHPQAGPYTAISFPAIVDGQRYEVSRHAPVMGEQTREVLLELGYGQGEIDRLLDQGVIADRYRTK